MPYKRIGKKSPIKSFKKRKAFKKFNVNNSKYADNKVAGDGRLLVPRSLTQKQYARIVEVGVEGIINANTPYPGTFNINDFPRASAMASLFMFYRPIVVTYKYVPLFNTYQDETGATKPQMYMLMNRAGNPEAFNLDDFHKMGSVPREFTRSIKLQYKPNTIIANQVVTIGAGYYNQGVTPHYGWVQTYNNLRPVNRDSTATNTLITFNNPTFHGHDLYVQQDATGASTTIAKTIKQVVWEFKHPRYPDPVSQDAV